MILYFLSTIQSRSERHPRAPVAGHQALPRRAHWPGKRQSQDTPFYALFCYGHEVRSDHAAFGGGTGERSGDVGGPAALRLDSGFRFAGLTKKV